MRGWANHRLRPTPPGRTFSQATLGETRPRSKLGRRRYVIDQPTKTFRAMSESTPVIGATAFEFRCSNCYQPLRALVEDAGTSLTCPWCEATTVAPAAPADRIELAAAGPVSTTSDNADVSFAVEEPLTRAQLRQMASERAEERSRDNVCRNPAWMSASRFRRLLAVIADALIVGAAAGVGSVADVLLVRFGIFDTRLPTWSLAKLLPTDHNVVLTHILSQFYVPLHTLVVIGLFMSAILAAQWTLIAVRGQSLGKKCLRIKIVTGEGQPPGFFCGVIVRNFSRGALAGLQMFGGSPIVATLASATGLADVLFIFREPPRCLHDHLAGTYVIDA